MSTPRQDIAEQMQADNAQWRVLPYPFIPENVAVGRPVVSVWRGGISPGDKPQTLKHSVTICVFGSRTKTEKAEDELDDLLDGVCLSLARLPGWSMEKADRRTFRNDTLTGWEIEASAQSANVYREAVMTERREQRNG